ncbi:MAG: radical SAM protein [Nanoarchaeota archaeon]|nr:radical SAM protein [Nanoarchaeota archaeon]
MKKYNKLKEILAYTKSKYNKIIDKPSVTHLNITDRCNFSCQQCSIWKKKTGKELTTNEWEVIIKKLKNQLKIRVIKFTGGEPLLRHDIFRLIEFCKKNNLFTGMSTNAYLIDKENAKKLKDAGLNEIFISIDSIKKHDILRRRKGAYQKAINAINLLKTSDMFIGIATVITNYNLKEILNLVDFAKQNKLDSIFFQPLYQNFGEEYDPKWYLKSELLPKYNLQLAKIIDSLIEFRKKYGLIGNPPEQLEVFKQYFKNPKKRFPKECKTGTSDIAIDPYGNMLLCFNLKPIGNLLKKEPLDLWNSDEAEKRRKEILNCKRTCNLLNCNFKQ